MSALTVQHENSRHDSSTGMDHRRRDEVAIYIQYVP